MFHYLFSMFHRAFFNSIIDKTPTHALFIFVNPLKPNDLKKSRIAQLTSTYCILYIYSTNKRTEYFKHAA